MATEYVMTAIMTPSVGPATRVWWAVLNTPDYTGDQSGYLPTLLSSIVIDYSGTVVVNSGVIAPQPINGDLSVGNSIISVIGLRGKLLSTALAAIGSSQDGYALVWDNSDGYWNAKPAVGGGSFTAGGDLTGTSSSQTVVSLTGSSGAINIASSGNILTWNTATTAPGIKQADNTTNSATAANTTIQAQNATGTTSNGGFLKLQSGTGTSIDGYVQMFAGSTQVGNLGHSTTDYLTLGPSPATTGYLRLPQIASIYTNDGGTNSAVITTTTGVVNIGNTNPVSTTNINAGGYVYIHGGSGVEISGGTIYFMNSAGTTAMSWSPTPAGSNSLNFAASNTSQTIKQLDSTTNSGTGSPFTIQAQNNTGTTSIGGTLNLTSGTGSNTDGYVNLQAGGISILSVNIGNITAAATEIDCTGDGYCTPKTTIGHFKATGSSQATAFTAPTPNTGGVKINVAAIATSANGADVASWDISLLCQYTSGTLTIQGTTPSSSGVAPDNNSSGASGWLLTVDVNGTTPRLRFTATTGVTLSYVWQAIGGVN